MEDVPDADRIQQARAPWDVRPRTELDWAMTESREWGIDVTGITRDDASRVVTMLESSGFEASAVDPSRSMTWYLDRPSVEILASGLRAALESGQIVDHVTMAGLSSLLEDCEEWLE